MNRHILYEIETYRHLKPIGSKPIGSKPIGSKPIGSKPIGSKPIVFTKNRVFYPIADKTNHHKIYFSQNLSLLKTYRPS
jgi:hypothetical protein